MRVCATLPFFSTTGTYFCSQSIHRITVNFEVYISKITGFFNCFVVYISTLCAQTLSQLYDDSQNYTRIRLLATKYVYICTGVCTRRWFRVQRENIPIQAREKLERYFFEVVAQIHSFHSNVQRTLLKRYTYTQYIISEDPSTFELWNHNHG